MITAVSYNIACTVCSILRSDIMYHIFMICDIKHSLALTHTNIWVYREAWSTDTLSSDTVAISTILALAQLLTGLAIKSWSARLIAVET